jgi:uncharacterized protein YndB with AHSA1/START domain
MSATAANSYSGTASIIIGAKVETVWDALTNPAIIKQYLFGTEAASDWKVGSPISYKGVWEGKPYEDGGTIVDLIPNRLLRTTYWTASSGPENALLVSYALGEEAGGTKVTITTERSPSREAADQSSKNWAYVLQTLKDLLEK